MSSIFPIRQQVQLDEDRGPRLVDLDDDLADDVFEALSSRTTRRIFRALQDAPQTASDLAALTDTSVQNAQYHVEKLIDVELVQVADTWYSERGTEMKVYAPTDESLVLFAGRDTERTLRSLLTRLAGGVGLLAPASLLVWWLADRYLESGIRTFSAGGGSGGDGADGPSIAVETAPSAAETAAGMDPAVAAGLAFFLGGAFVLVVAATFWYWRN